MTVMKRIICAWLAVVLLAVSASAQSLGDVAKKNRTQKKPAATRVFTDEDLGIATEFNNGAASGLPVPSQPADADKAGSSALTAGDKAKLAADWRARFDEQKKAIALLERELDVTQREYKQQVALYYSDAANRLRDQRAWAEQQRKYESDVATKQKDLETARQKLETMKEDARKAGMPSSISE